jgi:ATP-dependent DNA ligase
MFGRRDPAFIVFDVFALEGRDVREYALMARKKIL